eukprot:c14341_g1_i1 orf=526-1272(-)
MLRVKATCSLFLQRGGSCSPSHLRLSSHTCNQFRSLANLGKQAPVKLLPCFMQLTHPISVKQFFRAGGIAAAAAFASSSSGCRRILYCQETAVADDSPAQDQFIEWDDDRSPLFLWLRRLWVPLLMVMTVAMGWHYPLSLGINLVFLLWSTKPTPSSIYIWVEEKRLQAAQRTHGLSRLRAQLSNASLMTHVEVRDYGVACLARVSSLSQKMLMIGVLGDWWVLYSCSSSISGFNIGSWFPFSPSDQW